MSTVNFFHLKLPVVGDPEPIKVGKKLCKFWTVVDKDGKQATTCRTSLEDDGWTSLQERLDEFIRKDSGASSGGYAMIWAKSIRPATRLEIDSWLQAHIDKRYGTR